MCVFIVLVEFVIKKKKPENYLAPKNKETWKIGQICHYRQALVNMFIVTLVWPFEHHKITENKYKQKPNITKLTGEKKHYKSDETNLNWNQNLQM